MADITNMRITIQAENLKLLLRAIECIKERFGSDIEYQTPPRQNTRIPFPRGMNTVFTLALPEEGSHE